MSEQKTTQQPEQELSEQRRVRREKLAALQAAGEDPFQQTRFDWDATSAQIKEHFDQMEGRAVKVAGRLMSKRGMGKVSFCDLQDRDGRIQLYARQDEMDEAEYNLIKFPQRGVCLYKCGNERYLLEVHAPSYKEKLFGTAGGR